MNRAENEKLVREIITSDEFLDLLIKEIERRKK
jgi:hypothetical protein